MSNWSTQVDFHKAEIAEINTQISYLQEHTQELQNKRQVHLDVLSILSAADHFVDDTELILNKIPLVDAEKLPLAPELMVIVLGKLLPHAPESLLKFGSLGARSITGTRNMLFSIGLMLKNM